MQNLQPRRRGFAVRATVNARITNPREQGGRGLLSISPMILMFPFHTPTRPLFLISGLSTFFLTASLKIF